MLPLVIAQNGDQEIKFKEIDLYFCFINKVLITILNRKSFKPDVLFVYTVRFIKVVNFRWI